MNARTLNRRKFFQTAGAIPMAAAAASPAQEGDRPGNLPVLGEPYELAGQRMAFLNWFYIRTGSFAWVGPDGKKVSLTDSVPPGVAQFRHLDQPYGIRIRALPARRMGPLLNAEKPWEEGSVTITTVIKDGGMYRGWGGPFTTSGDPPGQKHYMYFESDNGLDWKRRNVGVVAYNGSRENNIVNILGTDGGSVFVDPSAPPAERYKVIAEGTFSRDATESYLRKRAGIWDPRMLRNKQGGVKGVMGAVSNDGLHWSMLPEPMVVEITDTQLTAYYDDRLRKYVAFTRTWISGERSHRMTDGGERAWTSGRRAIGRSETSNFREFPVADTILEPGPDLMPTDLLYTNGKTTFPGAPEHHFLFPTIWHTSSDSTSVAMATSHDGNLWHFLPGSPILSTGNFGDFDGGCIFAHPNLTELPNGDFVLPYTGYNVPHKYPRTLWHYSLGYALWPKGRIVALEAPERGEFATVSFFPPGGKLRINALTRRGGSILVEVVAGGKIVEGRSFADASPVVGDQAAAVVNWNGKDDLGHPENSPVFLRFRLDQAQLFSLEFV
jgi:hypothetical protein